MNVENELLEKEEPVQATSQDTFKVVTEPESKNVLSIFAWLVVLFLVIILVFFGAFAVYQLLNNNIIHGISVKGIDVSGLSAADAKYQLDNYLKSQLPEEITLKHGDFESTISTSQMNIAFDTKSATNLAFSIGRDLQILLFHLF